MQITIDTTQPLSNGDRGILNVLLAGPSSSTVVTEPAVQPATRPTPPPAKVEPEPEVEEDLIGGGEEPLTVQDAIDAATALVNAGQQNKVKAALKATGIDRVSNVPLAKVADFIAALEG